MIARHERRPRVLGARFGANPNSSSLSISVTELLFGSVGGIFLGFVLSALLRGRRPKEVGAPRPEPPK
jgi:hypothetical protein